MNNITNLLITGGGGYVGSNTINTLFCLYPNITFIVIDLKKHPTYIDKDVTKSSRFKYYQADIGNSKKMMKILKKYHIKYVLDLASFLPWDLLFVSESEFIANNVISRNTFFNTCIKYGKIEHILYQSSMLAITNTSDNYNSSKNDFPPLYNHILYATTKSSGLSLCYNTLILNKLPVTIISPMHIYGGKNQHTQDMLLGMTRELCETGHIVLAKNSNTNYDSLISIYDVIEGYCIIFNQGFNGKNYNLINQHQYYTPEQTAKMIIKNVTNSTNYDEYLVYDNNIVTPVPNVKTYHIKSNFPDGVFVTDDTFELELRKIAKCEC